MSELKYIETLTVAEFKQRSGSPIEVYKNPNTEKIAFQSGSIRGAVSANYKENPVLSLVQGDEAEPFWLLHKRSSQNIVDTL